LKALEKAYVAGHVEPEQFIEALKGFGVHDPVDVPFLIAALDACREWGVSEPTMTQRVAEERKRASDRQVSYIQSLLSDKEEK